MKCSSLAQALLIAGSISLASCATNPGQQGAEHRGHAQKGAGAEHNQMTHCAMMENKREAQDAKSKASCPMRAGGSEHENSAGGDAAASEQHKH